MKFLILILLGSVPTLNARAGQPYDDSKKAALTVLEQKCNVCHRSANPGKVFTIDNMEGLAPKIYKQVFVKRRMPKGRNIQLTEEESQVLKNWVETKVGNH
ncbi:MAG TPA: hypothetical protein VGE90_15890 [Chitinophaga sp.]